MCRPHIPRSFNSNQDYAAPIGSKAAGAAFKDTWSPEDVDAEWVNLIEAKHPALHRVLLAALTDSDKSCLVYMAARLLEMHRVLKPTGSLWLHCNYETGHCLKLVLDAVFGRGNFRNEIIWAYTSAGSPGMRQFNRTRQNLFWFAKSDDWVFNADELHLPHHSKTVANYKTGLSGPGFAATPLRTGKVPESCWAEAKGNGFTTAPRQKKQYQGCPTQKPIALLESVIKASSYENDMVLDPFCGCATTCVASERLNRKWAGIDLSHLAGDLVERRAGNELGMIGGIQTVRRTDTPQRTDLGKTPRYNHPENRKLLYGEQSGYCAGCNVHFPANNLEVDHIISIKQGGTDHIGNLQLLCGSCNRIKGGRGMEYPRVKLQLV